MRQALLVMLLALGAHALTDVAVPNTFVDSAVIEASEFNDNFDTLEARINDNADTMDLRFVRFLDLELRDSTLDTLNVDNLRSYPNADSLRAVWFSVDTIRSNPDVDSLGGNIVIDTITLAALRGDPDLDSLSGNIVIDSLDVGYTNTDTIAAFTLTGKLTAGATEIEGSNFDIDGGNISAGTVSGGLTWSATQDINNQIFNNVNINSGTIDGAPIGGSNPRSGRFTSGNWSQACTLSTANITTGNITTGNIDNIRSDPDVDSLSGNIVMDSIDIAYIDADNIRGAPDIDSIVGNPRVDSLNVGYTDTDTIAAFVLNGKLTAGATEIEGSNFDINGGDITGVTVSGGTVSAGLTWSAAQNLNSQALTNVDVNSGTIDGTDIGLSSREDAVFDSTITYSLDVGATSCWIDSINVNGGTDSLIIKAGGNYYAVPAR